MGKKVKINTDHRALQFISSCANASERIARWMSFMLEFDLEINRVSGKNNETADTLSREFSSNQNKTQKEQTFEMCPMLEEEKNENPDKWIEIIKIAQENDRKLQNKLRNNDNEYRVREGIVRVEGGVNERIAIPDTIAWELIDSVHKFLLHFGTDKITAFARKYFEIKNIDRIARDVVASCETCIATKYYTRPTREPEYYDLSNNKDKVISLDIFGPLPKTQNHNKYVIVTMDQFSKLIKCFPVTNQKLQTIIDTLDNKYLNEMRVTETIVTDNGGQFLTNEWSQYARRAGFQVKRTSPYNPQSNPVERVMRELERVIRAYYHNRQAQWDRKIDRFVKTVNNTQHFSTGESPVDVYDQPELKLEINQGI